MESKRYYDFNKRKSRLGGIDVFIKSPPNKTQRSFFGSISPYKEEVCCLKTLKSLGMKKLI